METVRYLYAYSVLLGEVRSITTTDRCLCHIFMTSVPVFMVSLIVFYTHESGGDNYFCARVTAYISHAW